MYCMSRYRCTVDLIFFFKSVIRALKHLILVTSDGYRLNILITKHFIKGQQAKINLNLNRLWSKLHKKMMKAALLERGTISLSCQFIFAD